MSNTVTVTGNITRDPELRFTANGQANATFSLADNNRWRDKQGEWHDSASFFDIVCWRELAENVAESLTKGVRIIVTGRLEQRSFEFEDGRKGTKVQIVADEIAPSLRWSTCDVRKNERRTPDTSQSRSPAAAAPADYEEPF